MAEFSNIEFAVMHVQSGTPGNPNWKGRLNTVDLLGVTSLDQFVFSSKILIAFVTEHQSVTKLTAMITINLVTPQAAAKCEFLCFGSTNWPHSSFEISSI